MPVLPEPQKNGGQSDQALGRSRGGFSTKIHVMVDGLGYPLRLFLTGGQRHDIIKANDLIADLDFDFDDIMAATLPRIFWQLSAPVVLNR